MASRGWNSVATSSAAKLQPNRKFRPTAGRSGRNKERGSPSLGSQLALFKAVVETGHTPVVVITCTRPCTILYANAAFEELSSYTAAELSRQPFAALLHSHGSSPGFESMRALLAKGCRVSGNLRWQRRDGSMLPVEVEASPTPDERGHYKFCILIVRGLNDPYRDLAQLRFFANHDTLTGLPNRRLLADRIEQALARFRRTGEQFAVAFLDLNGFKRVNDDMGHAAGDKLLKHVASHLRASVREYDTVARFGGDEFVILLCGSPDSVAAGKVMERSQAALRQPLAIDDREISTSCSVGLARCPDDGLDPSRLLEAADHAMYRAKKGARGNHAALER